jgi:hypothetical protein
VRGAATARETVKRPTLDEFIGGEPLCYGVGYHGERIITAVFGRRHPTLGVPFLSLTDESGRILASPIVDTATARGFYLNMPAARCQRS